MTTARVTTALVTGATGFIGSAVVRRLLARGKRVKAFVRPGSILKALEDLPWDRVELAVGDATLESSVYRALMNCDELYHVAAVYRYQPSRPEQILAPSILGTRAVLEAARRHGISRIVVTSSTAILGTTQGDELLTEASTSQLRDPEVYVRAKIEAARLVDEYAGRGMPIVSVLPAGVFGPGDRKPTPNGRSLLDYLALSPSFKIPVTDGGVSIVDVDDVAEGHCLALEHGRPGERYILGGDNLTFRQLFQTLHQITGLAQPGFTPPHALVKLAGLAIETLARFTGKDPVLTARLARDFAYARVWVSNEKAERELGYRHRPAVEALTRALKFYLEHGYVPRERARRVRLATRPITV